MGSNQGRFHNWTIQFMSVAFWRRDMGDRLRSLYWFPEGVIWMRLCVGPLIGCALTLSSLGAAANFENVSPDEISSVLDILTLLSEF